MNTQTEKDHAEMVRVLAKDPLLIMAELTPERTDLWHAGTGIASEAGELIDAVKKCAVYNRDIDRNNVIEELGDLEFYMQQIRSRLGITRETTLDRNMLKLAKRYEDFKYTDQRAQERADKI